MDWNSFPKTIIVGKLSFGGVVYDNALVGSKENSNHALFHEKVDLHSWEIRKRGEVHLEKHCVKYTRILCDFSLPRVFFIRKNAGQKIQVFWHLMQ